MMMMVMVMVITMMISRYHDDGDDHLEILFHRQASSNEEYLEQKVSRGYCCPFCSLGGLHPGLINIELLNCF